MNKSYRCVTPDFYPNFACIADECKNNCCHGWVVSINKDTFYKYKRLPPNNPIKELIERNVRRDRKGGVGREFGKSVMKEDGYCPFLDESGLCQIQKHLGADYLSDTCNWYPRTEYIIDSMHYQAMELSCEAAARLALLKPEGISFLESKSTGIDRECVALNIDTSAPKYARSAMRFYHEMRFFTINLLQNRSYEVWERMLILGMFYNKVQLAVNDEGFEQIPALMNQYITALQQDAFRENLAMIPLRLDVQLKVLSTLASVRRITSADGEFADLFTQMMSTIFPPDAQASDDEATLARLQSAYDLHYLPYMKDHAYVLENYLVCSVFHSAFPLANNASLFSEFSKNCVIFCLIKLFLIGVGAAQNGLTDDLVIEVVSKMERVLSHDSAFKNKLADTLQNNNMANMAYLATLLKN